MKYIISLSGGIGSYFTLKRVLEKQDKEDVIAVFCDTLQEDGDLYRFLNDIENKFDLKIIRLSIGKTPFELAYEANFKEDECILYLGIDWTETHRCEAIRKNYKPYKVEFPMCQNPLISKYEMLEELKNEGIEIPRLYKLGFSHNNCKGCCFKAGIGHFKLLLEKDRITYLEFENKEQLLRKKLNKDVSILKRKGKTFTLRQLRGLIENTSEQLSLFECSDFGGCGCFME